MVKAAPIKIEIIFKKMKRQTARLKGFFFILFTVWFQSLLAQEWYQAPSANTHTRWASPENPDAEKGKGGLTNKGAKGNAFFIVKPGAKQVLLNVKGAGIIQRMWMSGTIAKSAEQRRAVRLDMYWDDAAKPAVSAPIGDFFGIGLGLMSRFDSELFYNPEGRSFNVTIPMPYRKSARIEIINESSSTVLFWYDINYLEVDKVPENAMYFHAYWSRNLKTELAKDFEILPRVAGIGRYLGATIGVVGDKVYEGTWFGEGEVKVYLDGDKEIPTLVGTGTEDYIGSGWGQGHFYGKRSGSFVSVDSLDIHAFYRYHTADPVYFHADCRVTIQQMGNSNRDQLRRMVKNGAELKPVWLLQDFRRDVIKGKTPEHVRLLDQQKAPDLFSDDFPAGLSTNYYRRDDVSATAYFYLNRPESNLPALAPVDIRLQAMQEKVWSKIKSEY